jgi:hypothetical protein
MLDNVKSSQHAYAVLRLSVAMCFIGHGIFGIITKQVWCNYFALFGIGPTLAYRLMPVVGLVDIVMGLGVIFYPLRLFFVWLVIWGMGTALFRPLAGEPLAEMVERAGNYGAPLALLLLDKGNRQKSDLQIVDVSQVRISPNSAIWCLKITACCLLAGHGWLNILGKKAWEDQYQVLSAFDGHQVAVVFGCAELAGALLIQVERFSGLILLFLFWKMVSEALYPQYPLIEWIERGGSYGVLLAAWCLRNPSMQACK